MQLDELLKTFGYADSPNLLQAGQPELQSAPALGHVFRLAASRRGLKGVYTLRPPSSPSNEPLVPIVYICEAATEDEADKTHRLVWNQDVVPFVLVQTLDCLKLYSGFCYRKRRNGPADGLLRTLRTASDILQLAESLGAEAIDDGKVWRSWGKDVRIEGRVEWRLLEDLQRLDQWLQRSGLKQEASHALIGKYVYLHYLKDRDILSKRKLNSWGISEEEVFGRQATLAGTERTIEKLDEWLNGDVFPIRFSGKHAPKQEHLRRVAATFMGDRPIGDDSWQLHLDFQAYDFSYIPIETLSVIYEQFLHAPRQGHAVSRGRQAGAYYTPLPVVNFMLAEMEDRSPLRRGMRVLDPSCGSGAFLVQCYRRLIERDYQPGGPPHSPIRLRELLQEHIFGIDRDPDACSVTELSLILTLLDYVDPPDLENDKRVKLPSLRGTNIFCEDFFAEDPAWHRLTARRAFDWVVGNPPWKKLNPKKLNLEDEPIWDRMLDGRSKGKPIGGNQVAQVFTWAAGECLSTSGQAGLLVPAMTLFEDPSEDFRAAFLKAYELQAVANFSNLAEVLFAGRSRVPAAAVFFRPFPSGTESLGDQFITTYAPLVANQEPTRPVTQNTRQEIWSLVLNASEVRDIPLAKVATGSGLPWKLASWGSELDEQLLRRLQNRFPRFGQLENEGLLIASEGLQLRRGDQDTEEIQPVPDLIGKPNLDVRELEEMRHFFAFPSTALKPINEEKAFARRGRVNLPLSVCRPPHVIVSAARTFAIYSDEFVVVPPRQIGIASPSADRNFLIAISLFLSSDFAYYHQFLTSTQFGVKREVATLNALREMPIPVEAFMWQNAEKWTDLHSRLTSATVSLFKSPSGTLFPTGEGVSGVDAKLLHELNELVSKALGLADIEQSLVRDLVEIKLQLTDGKLGRYAVEQPSTGDIKRYARQLKLELDGFIEGELPGAHKVEVLIDDESGLVAIDLVRSGHASNETRVYGASEVESAELVKIRARLRREQSQWVYFDRNLHIFEDRRTFVLKPLQRFHWTISQAVCDATELIAGRVNIQGKGLD